MKIRCPDASPLVQHDSFCEKGKSQKNLASLACFAGELNIKNKANFKIGKIDITYYMTSEYEVFIHFEHYCGKKTNPICRPEVGNSKS